MHSMLTSSLNARLIYPFLIVLSVISEITSEFKLLIIVKQYYAPSKSKIVRNYNLILSHVLLNQTSLAQGTQISPNFTNPAIIRNHLPSALHPLLDYHHRVSMIDVYKIFCYVQQTPQTITFCLVFDSINEYTIVSRLHSPLLLN